ncbi:MAG: AAA family ATPase [bacterium]|nr:AAA family ATPase [bacterium]
MIIIGITGTLSAGKGTIVEWLLGKYGFVHYSVRDFITEEIVRRKLPVNRDTMVEVANDLRKTYHPGYIVEELCKKTAMSGKNSVIESIRTVGEIDTLKAFLKNTNLKNAGKFYLFAVDADPGRRYERSQLRKSETDKVSFEKFLADEQREMDSDDPAKQNLAACIKHADFIFQNNGTIKELQNQVDAVVNKL